MAQIMTTKKKRMSMLDDLAAAGQPTFAPGSSMMSTSHALRSARDAVVSHQVWDLDPDAIGDGRIADRLDPNDVADLRDAIEANGQTVPILVRRQPSVPDRYLLVYGRRHLQAIRSSGKLQTVRALIASIGEDAAVRAQISENMGRRDLSFIERALFAQDLFESGFGNQTQVAEVLTVTRSSISMAIAISEQIGRDLIYAIGAAHGIGRPRWEALCKAIEARQVAPCPSPQPKRRSDRWRKTAGKIVRSTKGVSLDLEKGPFADWIEAQSQDLIEELHARWLQRRED
jgi:ParB family chromosome partitioning protein